MSEWQPIETAPKGDPRVIGPQLILGHEVHKWVRFGRYYTFGNVWYYSGTSERSQYSMVEGDAPTHWMPMPTPPSGT